MDITVQVITHSEIASLNEQSGIDVIAQGSNEVDALKFCMSNKPSVILLDYDIQKSNTESFIQSLLMGSPNSRVILLGNHLSDDIILNCLIRSIFGFLEWQDIEVSLAKAVLSVGKGEGWVSRRLVGLLIGKLRD